MELEVREVTGEEKARLNNRLKAYKNEMQRFEQDLVSSQIKIHVYGLSRCTSEISFLRAPLAARNPNLQAPVVQKVDSAIHRINLYPWDSVIGLPNTYPLGSDLSGW